ncbi:hypothetical protein EWM64_g640 [Hericium alpestre]|uniref:Uncharacterized protein n=1 Tax=Hericium alpestre TaxID=135208 RepID=A0A4Z0A8H2_9AGAM|nr:hypothetical protein EWM64_g640 [Hericium alpestre]
MSAASVDRQFMTSLRQRIPFNFSNDSDGEDTHILDEQEQEELIQRLRAQNYDSNELYLRILSIAVALSCFLHLIYLANPDKGSPLAVLLTPRIPAAPLPLANAFALLHAAIHLNLMMMSYPGRPVSNDIQPLPYLVVYPAAAVAPVLCLFLGLGLANIAWWGVALVIVVLHDAVHRWILQGEESIAQLEKLKYKAKGA